jgi:hypothetical protein
VDYLFITRCPRCREEFAVMWVMDPVRVGPESVARIRCPICLGKFYQTVRDLLPHEARRQPLATGRPIRSVEIAYDCSVCGKPEVSVAILHTDLPWEELSEEACLGAVCNNALCQQKGKPQIVRPARVRMGALNSDESVVAF